MTTPNASLEQRVASLEANAYRQSGQNLVNRAEHAHLTDGLNTISSDLRALTHEVRAKVVPRLDRIEADVAELKTDVAELKTDVAELKTGVNALLDHFQITRPS